jgi:multiple sugar transport system ATP-binding protein
MADVTLSKVIKKYDDVLAVRGIDLDIQDHEFVVLVGPSGCGKTTTLRMIAGLEDITDGEIRIRRSATSRWCFRTMRSTRI